MCGIAGFIASEHGVGDFDAAGAVVRMLRAQSHRGPDGAGILVDDGRRFVTEFAASPGLLSPPRLDGARCVLGHNWLAIQDTQTAARQPMTIGDCGAAVPAAGAGGTPAPQGRMAQDGLAIVFNGEIYNFIELRDELRRDGVAFRTESDTEVLLALWQREGAACLRRLRGMYAFAVYDRAAAQLWLVRDPFGIKPLYVADTSAGLLFASEIRAIHAAGPIARKLRPTAAVACAAAGINKFGASATLFEGVHEVLPGMCVRVMVPMPSFAGFRLAPQPFAGILGEGVMQRAGIWPSSYAWFYSLPPAGSGNTDADAAQRAFADELATSVRVHLRSRRRIATCLSGGLDSSTIATLVGRELGPAAGDFETFTICTAGPDDSEIEAAALVARRAGLRHRIFTDLPPIAPRDVLDMVVAYESPNHVIGPINQYLLLREIAASGATVVLDGQGGDELVSGYPWYAPVLLADIERRGGDTTALRQQLAARLPLDPATAASFDRMFHDPAAWVAAFVWQGEFLGWSQQQLLELDEVRYYTAGGGDWQAFREREYHRAELQYLLRQEDRLGMWFGLECRVPMVDVPLVEAASRLPAEELIRDGWLKHPLRAMMHELPDEVRWNPRKRGFWETDRTRFPWVAEIGLKLAAESPCLREVFPTLPEKWPGLSFDQHWRLLQLAVLERCASREDVQSLGVGRC